MKNDKSGFWKAICADPDDDVPRLVFADYLDEQGHPERAELIRAQCDLEALPISDPRRIDLEMTSRWLLQEYQHQWNEELPQWIDRDTVRFRRGFPYRIETTPSQLDKNRSALAKSTVIQQIDMAATMESIIQFRLRSLGLGTKIRSAGKQSGLLPRLRGYHIHQGTFSEIVGMMDRLVGLRELSLGSPFRGTQNRNSQVEKLFQHRVIRQVTRLRIELHSPVEGLEDTPLALSIANTQAPALKHLTLSTSRISTEAGFALMTSPMMKSVECLDTDDLFDPTMPEGVRALTHLKALKISFLHPESPRMVIDHLSACKDLRKLSLLCLFDDDFRHLTESRALEQLIDLHLNPDVGWLSKKLLEGFLNSGRLSNLVRLTLRASEPTQIFDIIAQSKQLPRLRHLILPDLIPNKNDLRKLAKTNLKSLSVDAHRVPDFDELKEYCRSWLRLMIHVRS